MDECGIDPTADSNNKPLSGFLNRLSEINLVKGLKYAGTLSKRRWFIYSEDGCKLFYYKHKNDVEPIGVIDIANCSFTYDLESGNDRQFSIRSEGKEVVLEAVSSHERLYWLQQLQISRREYNLKLNLCTDSSKIRLSIAKPECGLIQDDKALPAIEGDPMKDMITPVAKPEPLPGDEIAGAKSSLPILASLPLSLFRNNDTPSALSSPGYCEKSSPLSPSQETRSFDRFSRKLRNSLRLGSHKSLDFDTFFIEKENIGVCSSCHKLQEKLNVTEDEVCNLKDSCEAYKDAVEILQKQIGGLESQKITLEGLNKSPLLDGHILDILREKDYKIVDLELSRQKLMNTLYKLTSDLRDSRIHSEKLEDKLSMVISLIEAKDKAILSLTSENRNDPSKIDDVKASNRKSLSFYTTERVSIGTQTSYSEYESMKDMLEGYKDQNKFLNKEIIDLHALQEHHKERERRLISESSDWEAKFYQIQSKYLLLLNDLHSPQLTNKDSDVISQLLHDLVESSGTTDLRGIRKQGKEYDEYGFCQSAPTECDINAKASFLQKKSKALASQAENAAASATSERKWESFLASNSAKDILQHPELKYLIRQGIPYQYKGKIWSLLIHSHVSKYKESLSSNYYQSLLVERASCITTNAVFKQIEIDLLRTLPNNWHYQTLNSDGVPRLRRVLLAYSRRNTDVGYCQGLNRLAAIALLFLKEEDAFWCLVYIIECLMPPNFYGKNLLGSQVDQRVMKDLIAIKLPLLASHFEQYGLDISLFTFNWFLCVFIDVIPPSIYLYIWDCFLYEGTKVLFRFALAIFKLCEENITTKRDYLSIVDYLRSVPAPVLAIQKLHNAAFRWSNPLSMRYIRSRRDYHKVIVEAELAEVEAVRNLYKEDTKKKEKETHRRNEVGSPPSFAEGEEDDDPENWEIIGLNPPTCKKKDCHSLPTDIESKDPSQDGQSPSTSIEMPQISTLDTTEELVDSHHATCVDDTNDNIEPPSCHLQETSTQSNSEQDDVEKRREDENKENGNLPTDIAPQHINSQVPERNC